MTIDSASLINLLGFITGGALYAMLLVMVLGRRAFNYSLLDQSGEISLTVDRLPFFTAILGLFWNISGILVNGLPTVVQLVLNRGSLALLIAIAFTTLGYLPAVVVHSVLRSSGNIKQYKGRLAVVLIAYALSTVASIIHFYSAVVFQIVPSHIALHLLTYGYAFLILVLVISTRGQTNWRAGWIVALAGFAVSAVHLSHHDGQNYAWWLELIGHHASLPLVLAILYQDFRFALADIFLKRAFSLLILVSIVALIYETVIASASPLHLTGNDASPRLIGLLLTLWVGTALLYPQLRRGVDWFVDTVVLRRIDYVKLRADLVRIINDQEDQTGLQEAVCRKLTSALTAQEVRWVGSDLPNESQKSGDKSDRLFSLTTHFYRTGQLVLTREASALTNRDEPELRERRSAKEIRFGITTVVYIPTTEAPHNFLIVGELRGGRHLLSDDIAILESVALLAARRIDALRVNHERCEREMREHEISKLATEAELRALRAQLNPHFLFNALTTISYLIQSSPKRAQNTLMRLTGLLRGVLRRSEGEFTTLGDEIDLVKDYLEIEQARFEERLEVKIDIPSDFFDLRIPSLILQPLVENAVKHGISPAKAGGSVMITAHLVPAKPSVRANELIQNDGYILRLAVHDTGAGVTEHDLSLGRKDGFGLLNVEKRLECHYRQEASLVISSVPGSGTVSEISLPVANYHGNSLSETRTTSAQTEAGKQ